jgi:hypothetical protein
MRGQSARFGSSPGRSGHSARPPCPAHAALLHPLRDRLAGSFHQHRSSHARQTRTTGRNSRNFASVADLRRCVLRTTHAIRDTYRVRRASRRQGAGHGARGVDFSRRPGMLSASRLLGRSLVPHAMSPCRVRRAPAARVRGTANRTRWASLHLALPLHGEKPGAEFGFLLLAHAHQVVGPGAHLEGG